MPDLHQLAGEDRPIPRIFPLGDVLSVTTGINLSPLGFQGVTRLLEYLIGATEDEIGGLGHSILFVAESCKEELLRQFPQLSDIDDSQVTQENYKDWLTEQEQTFGKSFSVTPIKRY